MFHGPSNLHTKIQLGILHLYSVDNKPTVQVNDIDQLNNVKAIPK